MFYFARVHLDLLLQISLYHDIELFRPTFSDLDNSDLLAVSDLSNSDLFAVNDLSYSDLLAVT